MITNEHRCSVIARPPPGGCLGCCRGDRGGTLARGGGSIGCQPVRPSRPITCQARPRPSCARVCTRGSGVWPRRALPRARAIGRGDRRRPREELLHLGVDVCDCGEGSAVHGVLGGDLLAEVSRRACLQAADLLVRFAGLVLGGFHLDPERRGTQRRLTVQPGDEPRLDLRFGECELPGEAVVGRTRWQPRSMPKPKRSPTAHGRPVSVAGAGRIATPRATASSPRRPPRCGASATDTRRPTAPCTRYRRSAEPIRGPAKVRRAPCLPLRATRSSTSAALRGSPGRIGRHRPRDRALERRKRGRGGELLVRRDPGARG